MAATRRAFLGGASCLLAAQAFAQASVTVTLYTSLGCGHCARFHLEELPRVSAERFDTGVARLDIRPFPLDPRSLAGFMLLRGLPDEAADQTMDRMFATQGEWLAAPDATPNFRRIMTDAGLPQGDFDRLLNDAALQAEILALREAGMSAGVRGTPTFFIGADMHPGALTAHDLISLIDQQT